MKIQTQTALLFTLLAAGVILVLNAIIYYATGQNISNDFQKRLQLRVVLASKIHFEKDSTSAAYSEFRQQYLETLPSEKQYILKINLSKDSIILPPELHIQKVDLKNLRWDDASIFKKKKDVYFAGLFHQEGGQQYLIIKSARDVYGSTSLRSLRQILLIGFAAKILIVFFVSFYFSRIVFKPFRTIISRVNSIGVENLSLRLPEKKGKDEIYELTKTFNGMLDRLQTAFDIQNNFVSNASHELKTPLTTIIGEAELILSKNRSPQEYKQALELILKESEKLEALTTALLSLAQSGFDKNKENLELIRLDELLFEIKSTIDRIDPGNKVRLLLEDMPVDEDRLGTKGNPQLIKLAITNIILNACKYSNNKDVDVRLTCPAALAQILIVDRGIGIPPPDMKHVFVPFFRASNTSSFKGYGVGLPLALNIIRQHGGNITVQSTEGIGTQVTVSLPILK